MLHAGEFTGETVLANNLVYVTDSEPGIRRRRAGKGFSYRDAAGHPLTPEDLQRIRKLGIPPAYRQVWICAQANGHLQATGVDARGRKQYRYHPLWQATRTETKYTQLAQFGLGLPAIRRRLRHDLRGEAGDLTFCLAALVLLLDRTYLRVGNDAYAAENRTFGATTLLTRHLSFSDDGVQLRFPGKGGKRVQLTLRDRRLGHILHRIGDLPGRRLFSWRDEQGQARALCSQHVNGYLAEITGTGATAKTFRTWGGTLAAFEVALRLPPDEKLSIAMMAAAAADRLGNTPAISRKSYIHPAVLDLAQLQPQERYAMLAELTAEEVADLRTSERLLLAFLNLGSQAISASV